MWKCHKTVTRFLTQNTQGYTSHMEWQSYLLELRTRVTFQCLHQSREAACLPQWLLNPLASLHMSTVSGRRPRTKQNTVEGAYKGIFLQRSQMEGKGGVNKLEPFNKSFSIFYIENALQLLPSPDCLMFIWQWQSCLLGHIVAWHMQALIWSQLSEYIMSAARVSGGLIKKYGICMYFKIIAYLGTMFTSQFRPWITKGALH